MSKIATTAAIAGGAAAGAGLMYLLDPDRGDRRRRKARKALNRAAHRAANQARVVADRAANQARGAASELADRSREMLNGGRRRRLKMPRSRGGQIAASTLAAAALAGGTAAVRALAYRH